MRWVLLLRAVNVGGNNKVPMKELVAVLTNLGHSDVRTYLNTGNATFTSSRRAGLVLAREVEGALQTRLGVDVRAWVGSGSEVRAVLEELPDMPGYLTCNVLFDPPDQAALAAFLDTDWSPEHVAGTPRAVYVGYVHAGKTKLTNGRIEKALGVVATARTPATLRKLLA
jgi:uncharacterized protein (DUF1697 family)